MPTDTERLEKLDMWLRENGWNDDSERPLVRFMDEAFEMHVRDWIDLLPEHEHQTAFQYSREAGADNKVCRYCGATV